MPPPSSARSAENRAAWPRWLQIQHGKGRPDAIIPALPTMSLAPGTRLGAYEVISLIGHGGMGEVYRARDTRLGRSVALKVLHAHLAADALRRERFEREARAVSRLNHPSICALYD